MKKKELKTYLLLSSFVCMLTKTDIHLESENTYLKGVNENILIDNNIETASIEKNEIPMDTNIYNQIVKFAYEEEPMDHFNYIEENYGKYIDQVAWIYGLDPTLVKALLSREYGIKNDNIAQIKGDIWENKTISVYNFSKEAWENFTIDEECFKNPYKNIQAGCVILQNSMYELDGNILAGLQGYNYGPGAVKICIKRYANDHGLNYEEVLHNITQTDWLNYVKEYHNGTHGDPNYVEHVLEHIHEEEYTLFLTEEDHSKEYVTIEKVYKK